MSRLRKEHLSKKEQLEVEQALKKLEEKVSKRFKISKTRLFFIKFYLMMSAFLFITFILFHTPIETVNNTMFYDTLCISIAISVIISPLTYFILFRGLLLLILITGIFWGNFIVFCIFSFTPIQSISATIVEYHIHKSSRGGRECYIQVNTHSNDVNQYLYKVSCNNKFEINQIITLNYKQNFLGIISAD